MLASRDAAGGDIEMDAISDESGRPPLHGVKEENLKPQKVAEAIEKTVEKIRSCYNDCIT